MKQFFTTFWKHILTVLEAMKQIFNQPAPRLAYIQQSTDDESTGDIIRRTESLQEQIDYAASIGANYLLIPGGYYQIRTISLPDRFTLAGLSGMGTELFIDQPEGEITHGIVSADYEFHRENGSQGSKWNSDGIPQGIVIRDLSLISDAFAQDHKYDDMNDAPDRGDAIHLFTNHFTVENVNVFNFSGTGIRVDHGYNTKVGGLTTLDHHMPVVRNVHILKCTVGVYLGGHDFVLDDSEIHACATGLITESSGAQIPQLHVYGCKLGVKLVSTAYFGLLVSETNIQAVKVESNAGKSVFSHLRVFGGGEADEPRVDCEARTTITALSMEVPSNTVGVRFKSAATSSSVTGEMALDAGSIGVQALAQKCRVTIDAWGGDHVLENAGTGTTFDLTGGNCTSVFHADTLNADLRGFILHAGSGTAFTGFTGAEPNADAITVR